MARVALALGSNLGDRVGNIRKALQALNSAGIEVLSVARLFESEPQYVTDQPRFLNSAALVRTAQTPLQLLDSLKAIEGRLGRDFRGLRNGPRPIDLDIVFYEDAVLSSERLTLPHPRWRERAFVKAPLADLAPRCPPDAETHATSAGLPASLAEVAAAWRRAGGERQLGGAAAGLAPWIPLPRPGQDPGPRGLAWGGELPPRVMGILNVTPDSFSDGGRSFGDVARALRNARAMVQDGADLLDVGGQSTRPGADPVSEEEEEARVIPVIRALRECEDLREIPLSIDTFYSGVAERAVLAGADIVNDVSGGRHDPAMFAAVAELGVPYILMHSYGTAQTMVAEAARLDGVVDVCAQVAAELAEAGARAIAAGIEPWRLILDPGLGFGKRAQHSSQILGGLRRLQGHLPPPLASLPLLIGASRKRFLCGPEAGSVGAQTAASRRDHASAAAAALAAAQGAAILRVHNVAATRDAVGVAHRAFFGAGNPHLSS
uniref:Pterin-binding domain-containing protein n=1 Tax=Auxenochlorella protothecoides TaxID=3075 RepID=A0A1D1ZNB3_AUXPR